MKISIITITYNSEATLEETIKSVINQGYNELEYIIVDGGSTDSTLNIVNKYRKFITKVISESDKGISDAFNKGIKLATGELIGIINSDDLLYPNALKYINKEIKDDTDIIYGDIIRFGDNRSERISKANDNIKSLEYGFSCMYHPSTFIRKRAYNKYGLYEINNKYCMDRELLLRMFKANAKFQRIEHVLAKFRVGGISCTSYNKTALESMKVSINYGLPIYIAYPKTIYNILKIYSIQSIRKFQSLIN